MRGSLDARRLRKLVEAGLLLGGELSLDALLERLVESAAALVGARYAALGVLDQEGQNLSRFITYGLTEAQKAAIGPEPTGRGLLGALLTEGRPLRLDDLTKDPRSVGFPPGHPPMHAFLGVPIMWRGEVFGRLYCTEKLDGQPFTTEDEELALLLAAQAASALENARLYAEAQEASRLKSEFLANMSHELRTPLTAILGFTDLVLAGKMGPVSEGQSEALGRVARNGGQLLELINDLLDLSKMEAGRMEVAKEPFLPMAVAELVVASLAPLAEAKGVALALRPAPKPGLSWGDEGKVRQVLTNLVGNAVKFTPPDGRVELQLSQEGGQWSVAVLDDGTGIDPKHHELIFDAFRQVDGTSTRAKGGSGLGLTISRRLARLMGGDLQVDSALGQGSCFRLALPQGEAPGQSKATPTPRPSGPKLLVVDDAPQAEAWHLRELGPAMGELRVVASGEGALAEALAWKPEAVVLDLGLEGAVDGWEVLRRLKANPQLSQRPLLFASLGEEEQCLALALGQAGLLTKPLARDGLREAAAQLLRGRGEGPILLVDEDPEAFGLALEALEGLKRPVVGAADLAGALAEIAQEAPALVVLDVLLPKLEGFELLAKLSREPALRELPLLLLLPVAQSPASAERLALGTRLLLGQAHLSAAELAHGLQRGLALALQG